MVSWFYLRIHGTYIAQLLKGVALILTLHLLAQVMHWSILAGVLQVILQISIIGFIILFQPELRRLIVSLGQPELFSRQPTGHRRETTSEHLVHDLLESARFLSKTKTGALMVLESGVDSSANYLEAGTRLDSILSTELLLTLFHPNTPLHDGAVIVSPDGRVVAAGVLLPLSENPNLSWKFGTRHRAAVGLTEISESRCLVVSEETGNISWVLNGDIQKLNSIDELKHHLEAMYGIEDVKSRGDKKMSLFEFFSTDLFQKFMRKEKDRASSAASSSRSRNL